MFIRAKQAADMADADLHFHDLRGTAATRFYLARLDERTIAEIMGWNEESVSQIIRSYVDRSAATKDIIRQLNKRRGGLLSDETFAKLFNRTDKFWRKNNIAAVE